VSNSRRRGSAFVTVIAVLAILAILMEIALQLVVTHINESRRRGDAAYAGQLARSGLEWARACIASGSPSCDRRLELAGGVITVTTQRDGELVKVKSCGSVMRGGAQGPTRETTTRVRPPDPANPAPSPSGPPEPGPALASSSSPDPDSPERTDSGATAPTPQPQPTPSDPMNELEAVAHP
jgi:type II secretory pathway pseudopilin PulG